MLATIVDWRESFTSQERRGGLSRALMTDIVSLTGRTIQQTTGRKDTPTSTG